MELMYKQQHVDIKRFLGSHVEFYKYIHKYIRIMGGVTRQFWSSKTLYNSQVLYAKFMPMFPGNLCGKPNNKQANNNHWNRPVIQYVAT